MLERLAIAVFFLFIAFFCIGGCWLVWREFKDKQEQGGIEKRIGNLPQLKIPSLDLVRMKERLWRAIKSEDQEIRIIQTPKEPPIDLADLNERRRRLCKVVNKAGISVAEFDLKGRNRGSRCSRGKP